MPVLVVAVLVVVVGAVLTGPGWISTDAPLHRIPLFIRPGAGLDLPPPATLDLPAG